MTASLHFDQTIHCCWFGSGKSALVRKCRESWERFAPGWKVREWNVETATALRDLPGYDFFTAAITAGKWAMASDWLRMAALWRDGGVYLDCDVELVGYLDSLCAGGEWIASEWTAIGETWLNPGSGIALKRGSAVAWRMLEAYAHAGFDPNRNMMPWINERLKECEGFEKGVRLRVLEPEVMSPIDMKGRLHRTDRTVGIHHYAMSWAGPGGRLMKWISWHGGRGLVDAAVALKHRLGRRTR